LKIEYLTSFQSPILNLPKRPCSKRAGKIGKVFPQDPGAIDGQKTSKIILPISRERLICTMLIDILLLNVINETRENSSLRRKNNRQAMQ
jgi:hypothetical protein